MSSVQSYNTVIQDDPGSGGAILVSRNHLSVALVTAGGEARTMGPPVFLGQRCLLSFKTDGGNCTVTVATEVNQAGNTALLFEDVGDMIYLIGCYDGANLRWRVVANDGVALS